MFIGIIGGSGIYSMEGVEICRKRRIRTPYGQPSDAYLIGRLDDREVVFLPRHGMHHSIPPHQVNYRANIWGFKQLGIQRIIAIGSAGGIHASMRPGSVVIPDQILDMSYGRESTFFDRGTEVFHVDFTEPYCPELRTVLCRAAKRAGIHIKKKGTYLCTNGPRLETKAEISFFSRGGADIVGMTAMPEAVLSREAEVCYAGISVVTNRAAGIASKKLTVKEVIEGMNANTEKLNKLLKEACQLIPIKRKCHCGNTLKNARV